MHIVAIRSNGLVSGFQLRIGSGGPGNSKFFATKKHSGEAKAKRAARGLALELGLSTRQARGGSATGRVLKTSTTRAAGIRFSWVDGAAAPVLRVVATWVDKKRQARQTSYSVERNGLEGALDMAIKARTSAGAEAPDRETLLKLLRKERRTGPPP